LKELDESLAKTLEKASDKRSENVYEAAIEFVWKGIVDIPIVVETRMKPHLILLILLTFFCVFPEHSFGQSDSATESLFPVKVGNFYGYINSRGELIIKPRFDSASKFHNGLALVRTGGHDVEISEGIMERLGGKAGYVDKSGKFVIPPVYDLANDFSEGLAAVWLDTPCDRSCYGYIDTTGKIAIPQKYQTAGTFHEGTADVRMADDNWGVIDRNAKFIIPPKYDGVFPFYDGIGIAIKTLNKKASPFDQELADFAVEFYDTSGNVVAKPSYFVFGLFENGLVDIITKSGSGFVDKNGNIAIAPTFEKTRGFSEGLAPVRVNHKWGYIDVGGKFMIDAKFDDAGIFKEGLAPVTQGAKEGFIDKSGTFVIPLADWIVYPFENGLAFVTQKDSVGYIDKKGRFVWKTN